MSDADNQDDLAAEWAAALGEQKEAGSDAGGGKKSGDEDSMAAEWAAALASETQASAKKAKAQASLASKAKNASFKDLTEEAKAPRVDADRRDLDFILDIPLDVSAELGRTSLLINELLQLGQGSVVELSKMAGEPLEVYVNGKLVARGEAVVINEKFGVRLTDIISPIERIKQLG
jgi:flagellar motor switch protein FliN/FliY